MCLLETAIIPLLGRKKLAYLSRADMERFMQDIGTGKTAVVEKTTVRGKSVVKEGKGTERHLVHSVFLGVYLHSRSIEE